MAGDPGDELLDAGADVVFRWKAYANYAGEAGAMNALRRRVPGHTPERYRAAFGVLCAAYDGAVSAVGRHYVQRPDKRSRFAEVADIDTGACLAELDGMAPELPAAVKEGILMRVIYWHYLR